MPLDPQAQEWLDAAAASGLPPIHFLRVADARQRMATALTANVELQDIYKAEDRLIPGPDTDIPIRIYTPNNAKSLPILVFIHGGGGVINSITTHERLCRLIANQAECIVVSVDYRLAPEYKFPAGLLDSYTATRWVFDNATDKGGDVHRIAIGGDSTGAQIAAGVTLLARDRNGPTVIYQVLAYPATDYYLPGTSSIQEYATGYTLTRDMMIWFWNHYIHSNTDLNRPYLCPLRAKSLANLPPALIVTANYDPLRDEGKKYAERLEEAGVTVTYKNYEGMMHGFLLQPSVGAGVSAISEIATTLRRAFSGRGV
ncbi:MAG TPA: alpha/beta hydrolase [Roseiflexaceae bacterium]|nr:alpha/beta hydrolase [Roseiflexaceae bacterium]